MRKIIYSLLIVAAGLLTSCEAFTDLKPKGMNLLSTVNDLEMLLNYEFYSAETDWQILAGDFCPTSKNLVSVINDPKKTKSSMLLVFDDSDMDTYASFRTRDYVYSEFYMYIGRICNPILSRVEQATGDEQLKAQITCEALVHRAFSYWILVNRFAKAYNPATAATDPGVPYLDEKADILKTIPKVTVQEIYDHMLEDINRAIEMDALPEKAVNTMRMNKACAYAVKAWILISMQKYDEAEQAAKESLKYSNKVDNYFDMLYTTTSNSGKKYQVMLRPRMGCEEDIFFVDNYEMFNIMVRESYEYFEKGHVCHDHFMYDIVNFDYQPGRRQRTMGEFYPLTMDWDSGWNYSGLKTTHMYLIVAEAEIMKGNYDQAMAALDKIREKRIDPQIYAPLQGSVTSEDEAILHLKKTSHGENVFSCYNFIQRKRWNQTEKFKETFIKEIGDVNYEYTPENKMWIFPFPTTVVGLNPTLLPQNYEN